MNKRIQELIKQCEALDGDGDGYFVRFDKEKFAELIIQECLYTIATQTTVETNKDFREGFHHSCEHICQEILRKFEILK